MVLFLLLMAFSVGPVAHATDAHVHMWWVQLPPFVTAHPYQTMDADTMTMSRIVQVSSTPTQWSYDVHACWDGVPDDSIMSWLATLPERRRSVYVRCVLQF